MTPVLHQAADKIGWITLNQPERMNAVTVELARGLQQAVAGLGNDPAVNVIVLRGAGGNFCAGGDFDEVERLRAGGPAELRALFESFRGACDAIAAVQVPVVAAVEGVAMAGGFELMQAADIVLVSEQARIADNHINVGMVPGGGSTQRLPGLVGRQLAMGLLLSGDRISGADAVRYGLAYRSFPQVVFDDGVQRFAEALAGRRRNALTSVKRLVRTRPGLDGEIDAVVEHICEQDASVFAGGS
ncbi:MAG TPA: enoyl-CoA hydratase/isomerase family protein [Mycobacterium sp.]